MEESKEVPKELGAIAAHLQELLQASNLSFQPALVPNYIKYQAPNIHDTPKLHGFHTGGALKTYGNIVSLFSWLLNTEPKIETNESADGTILIGRKVTYPNGLKLIYLSEKNAIGIQIPENEFESLRELIAKLPRPQKSIV